MVDYRQNFQKLLNDMHDLANEYCDSGMYEAAIRLYEKLSVGDQSYDDGFNAYQISKCYAALGDEKRAKEYLKIAVDANPSVYGEFI